MSLMESDLKQPRRGSVLSGVIQSENAVCRGCSSTGIKKCMVIKGTTGEFYHEI
ncbi:hypothetical protein [Anoxybacterium hadale]|uniref:hypothetical protein n=1 Tax=Anoxybacterium hadale TaxID=3408580 RepID=UPI003AFFEEE4